MTASMFMTLPNINEGAFLRKYLRAFIRYLLVKSSIKDVWQAHKQAFAVALLFNQREKCDHQKKLFKENLGLSKMLQSI